MRYYLYYHLFGSGPWKLFGSDDCIDFLVDYLLVKFPCTALEYSIADDSGAVIARGGFLYFEDSDGAFRRFELEV